MITLGIADNHDSSAAVCVDGALVAAVNQERVDRVKLSGAFPWGAMDEALRVAGIKERDVDRIVVGSSFTPSAILRAMPGRHHSAREQGQFSPWLHRYIVYQSALKATGLHTLEVDACRRIIARRLKARPFVGASVEMMDHHRAHAEGAYRTQGRSDCLVLTVDAMGDGTTATASIGTDGQLDLLWRQSGLASVNTLYSRVTEKLGFTPIRHEGKVTGLAAFVSPPEALVAHLKRRISFEAPGFSRVCARRIDRADDAFWGELDRWSREEVASATQRVLEDAVLAFVQHWIAKTGCPHVAVAGGAFGNVKLNQHIAALPNVASLWVMPHMGDGGLAVGAALGAAGSAPTQMRSAALGPGFTARECRQALATAGVPRHRPKNAIAKVAKLLAEGGIVARCSGRMEWGPRALGNRSILASPADASINDRLNKMLDRSEFMPFAPMVRQEDVERWFIGAEKAPHASRFMTTCFVVTEAFAAACPAAVHVDGTARPQVVHADQDPELHALLTAMGEQTGTPVLVNTSFNMHEEPLVCTPANAIRAWQRAGIDALWLGEQLLLR
jgi:carbamoyltransferase